MSELKGTPSILFKDDAFDVKRLPVSRATPDKGMVASVKNYGVLSPIIVVPDGDNQYKVVDGLRRLAASVLAGLEVVPVIAWNMSPVVADAATVMLNEKRSSNPVAELLAIERVMGRSFGTAEIVKATGIEKSKVNKLLELRLLSPVLREAFDSYRLPESMARRIIREFGDAQEPVEELLDLHPRILGKHLDRLLNKVAGKSKLVSISYDDADTAAMVHDILSLSETYGEKHERIMAMVRRLVGHSVADEPKMEELQPSLAEETHIAMDAGEDGFLPELEQSEVPVEDDVPANDGEPCTMADQLKALVDPNTNASLLRDSQCEIICGQMKLMGLMDIEDLKQISGWRILRETKGISEAVVHKLHFAGLLHPSYDIDARVQSGYGLGSVFVSKTNASMTRTLARASTAGGYLKDADGNQAYMDWAKIASLFDAI